MTPPVLVVEDDADFRGLVARILEGWGFAVAGAGSVREALARAGELRPGTVVTDVGLPDGDGFALARELSALPWRPRVVVISSDADAANREAARRAGAVAFVAKDAAFRAALRRSIQPGLAMPAPGGDGGAAPDGPRRVADAGWRVSEQSTLRRIATLVAEGASPDVVLPAVAQGVAALFNLGADAPDVAFTTILRYDGDGAATIVAEASGARLLGTVGDRFRLEGRNVATLVHQTGRAARLEPYDAASGEIGDRARGQGVRAVAGAPIRIAERLWGVICVDCTRVGMLDADTERLLAPFCGLVATAVANTEARAEAARLAEEQASLRRVATLVARQAPASELFEIVAREVGVLLEVDSSAVLRLEDDNMLTVLAAWGEPDLDGFVGRRLPVAGDNVAARSLATGRAARIDDHSGGEGEIAAIVRDLAIASSVAGPVMVEGRLWGWLAVNKLGSGLPPTIEARLEAFAELTAVAIANAEGQAQLAASRARVIATADETRRRLQRDLHDGAQQRLVHVLIALQMAADAAHAGQPTAGLIDEALAHADRANTELRDLVHGILPATLTQSGLREALLSVVADLTLPVELRIDLPRLAAEIETTAYFIVAEALTNVVKHARAAHARVEATLDDDGVRLIVADDGVGGADPSRGSGLTGLYDRVGANGGTLTITSPPAGGTTLQVVLRSAAL